MSIEPKSRREFLRNTAGGLMALAATYGWNSNLRANPLGLPIGTQVGWLKKECDADLDGTLQKLADFGYQEIEAFQPFFSKTPKEFRRILDAHGLKCPSAHWFYNPPKNPYWDFKPSNMSWDKQLEDTKQIGLQYVVMLNFIDAGSMKSLDDCKQSAEDLNKLGEKCRNVGVQLALHNHYTEFRRVDEAIVYDVLVKNTDPKLVTFELDCMWCKFAGQDPVEYLKRYPGRFSLLHIKDMKPGFGPSTEMVQGQPFAEVGQGVLNWKKIFAAAPRAGVKHYFVEQDTCDRPPLDSAKISCDYLKSLRV